VYILAYTSIIIISYIIFMNDKIISALNWRYGVQSFDTAKHITKEELDTVLESGRLAPSSIGLEPWKFIVVENPALRAQIRAVSWDQSKVTDATYLVVIARRTNTRATLSPELIARASAAQGVPADALDGLKQMADGFIGMRDDATLDAWNASQTYIPLGMMLSTAALIGVDAGPMEGFDATKVDEILGLREKNLSATTILTLGHRSAEDRAATRAKVRRAKEDVIEFVK
jgi:nitroreductase